MADKIKYCCAMMDEVIEMKRIVIQPKLRPFNFMLQYFDDGSTSISFCPFCGRKVRDKFGLRQERG